jgi:hypothetical protein
MLKKMLLAGGLVVVATGSAVQVLIGVMIAFGYFTFVVRLEPYEDILDDRLQACTSVQLIVNLLAGLILKLDAKAEINAFNANAIGSVLTTMNSIIIVVAILLVFFAFPQCRSRKQCMKAVKNCFKKTKKEKKLAKLMKELHKSLKGDLLRRALEMAAEISEHPPSDMEEARRQWANVLQAIPDKSRKRAVHRCFKLMYLSAVQKKGIDCSTWIENPMRRPKRQQSMWRISTDKTTGKIFLCKRHNKGENEFHTRGA